MNSITNTYAMTDIYRVVGHINEYPLKAILTPRLIHGNKCYGTNSQNSFHTKAFIKAHPEIFEQGPPPAFR